MKRRPRLLRVILRALTILALPVAAQEGELRFDRFDRLSTDDGLSVSTVWEIHQDSRGFLWIGTLEGLNRYDGLSFKVYKNVPGDPDSLSANYISEIYEDHQGELWVGTKGGGLNRFRRADEAFAHLRHDPADAGSLSDDSVVSLLEDHTGTLWVGTFEGLNRWDRRAGTFARFQHDPTDPGSLNGRFANALVEDRRGELWVGTDKGLHRFDRDTESFVSYRHDPSDPRSLSEDIIYRIVEDPDGYLWIATLNGLNRFDPGDGTVTRMSNYPADLESLSHAKIGGLHVDRAGELWIGTTGEGLHRLDRESGAVTRYKHDPGDPGSLSNNSILSIHEDRTGILWFGTYVGINKYDKRREQFVNYRYRSGQAHTLSSNNIGAVHEDASGTLWVGTYDNGLNKLDRERNTVVHYPPGSTPGSFPNSMVSALHEDRSGVLWAGTWDGLARYDRDHDRWITYRHDPEDPGSLSNDLVVALLEDSSGRFWVGTGLGFNELDRARERFIRYPAEPSHPQEMDRDYFYAIVEDHTGALWFGSSSGGLYRLTDHFDRWRNDPKSSDSLSSDKVASLAEDQLGNLWIGTYGAGLNRLGPARETFRRYREKDGLPSETVLGILEDDAGHLWLSTNQGLSRFDPRSETFENYDVTDGLQGNVFSSKSSFLSPGGEMFFGGTQGLTAFFPDRVAKDSYAPPVVLTEFLLFNRSVPLRRYDSASPLEHSITETRELVLTHRHQVFSFEFAALYFANPHKNTYAYRLEDFDREWMTTGASKPFAHYTNLDPGEYVFRVKASNGNGIWNDEAAAIKLIVLPPPWKSWWAYSLYALSLLGLILAFVRAQKEKVNRERAVSRRLREVDKLKDEFLANTSHELRTPLYGITGLAESLRDGVKGEVPGAVREDLSLIVSSGRRLSRLVNDILDFSKLKRGSLKLEKRPVDLHALTEVVLTLLRPLVTAKDLELVNAIDPALPPAEADENRLQQILYNLIGNAIKFTDSGTVAIEAVVEEGRLVVRVRDSGIGIAPDQSDRIFKAFEQADASTERAFGGTGLGLAVSSKLVSLHGGTLSVDSKLGKGSTFFFTLPISAGRPSGTPREAPSTALEMAEPLVVEPVRSPETARGEGSALDDGCSRILIVDDEPVNRHVLVNQLSAGRYVLSQASDGLEALRLLEDRDFDLVLLDVMMPKMSGYEVCRQIRERSKLEQLPVIFLTAKSHSTDLEAGFSSGASDYLTKPIARNELMARVRTHLDLLVTHRELERLLAERSSQIELLTAQALELNAKNAELEQFTYTVSHDLKSPLVTIKGFLGLLEKDAHTGDRERMRKDLEHLHSAAETMGTLLGDLLELSRVGRLMKAPERLSLSELAREAVALVAGKLADRGARVEISPELPEVFGDRLRLLQMLQNLVDNAAEYMGEQTAPRIVVGVRHDGDSPVFFVKDNGMGIEPQYHETIFGLFERLNPDRSEGTGIGLALAKRIVELHGGRIWVESEGRGRGSAFCFSLASSGGADR